MKIILLKNLDRLGIKGEVVEVKNGYAKNYLIPHAYAVSYSTKVLKDFDSRIKGISLDSDSTKLNDITIMIPVKKKNETEIYGVINSTKLSKIIKKLKLKLNIKHLENNLFITKISNYKIEFKNKKTGKVIHIYIMLINTN